MDKRKPSAFDIFYELVKLIQSSAFVIKRVRERERSRSVEGSSQDAASTQLSIYTNTNHKLIMQYGILGKWLMTLEGARSMEACLPACPAASLPLSLSQVPNPEIMNFSLGLLCSHLITHWSIKKRAE